jgi:hypothetical protein
MPLTFLLASLYAESALERHARQALPGAPVRPGRERRRRAAVRPGRGRRRRAPARRRLLRRAQPPVASCVLTT